MAARPLVRIFISYRREDSIDFAVHLQATLARRFGKDAVFRDESSLRAGQDFPRELENAIKRSTAVIALIGPGWFGPASATARDRLSEPNDFVRRELEIALSNGKTVIPVLIQPATMPKESAFPKSLRSLALTQALTLPWHEATTALASQINSVAREMATEIRVSMAAAKAERAANSRHAALMAMQASLANQGVKRVQLDARDLDATLKRISDLDDKRLVFFADLIYALDLIGVKGKSSDRRYVARSKPLASLEEIITHLQRNQTVLAGINRTMAWFREPAQSSDFIDQDPRPEWAGGVVGVISAWHVGRREFTVHTLDGRYGSGGVLTLTWKAAQQLIDRNVLRAIDATLLKAPASAKAQRDLQSRLPRKTGRRTARRSLNPKHGAAASIP